MDNRGAAGAVEGVDKFGQVAREFQAQVADTAHVRRRQRVHECARERRVEVVGREHGVPGRIDGEVQLDVADVPQACPKAVGGEGESGVDGSHATAAAHCDICLPQPAKLADAKHKGILLVVDLSGLVAYLTAGVEEGEVRVGVSRLFTK